MPQPLFSILIAQYNNGKFFEDCYNSIMAQTYTNWEVIIVDDASQDNSLELMKNRIGDDPRFKIFLNGENKGCGYTKRRCVELASGEICAFLDPDDAITEDALAIMVAEHGKHTEASIISSGMVWCDENLNPQNEVAARQVENGNPLFFDFDGFITHFLTFKKTLYNKTEGINAYLQRAIDKDLVLKLYEVGHAFIVDKILYKYRVHKGGISTNANQDKAYFWYWVAIIDAAKRRKVNVEDFYLEKALQTRREAALEKELSSYNKSFIFKALRKLGIFRM